MMQPPIAFAADQVYSLLVAFKILTPFSEDDIASGNEQVLARGEAGLPTLLNSRGGARGAGKREEAERRRAVALKALDRRLQAATIPRPQPSVGEPSQRPTTPSQTTPGQGMLGETSYNPDHA